MTPVPPLSATVKSTQPWLEITQVARSEAWRPDLPFSAPSGRWRAYLNRLCLDALLPWLEEEWGGRASPWPTPAALPSIWEVVNGTAVQLGTTRLILVPSESIDMDELSVPREWVDIPDWAADYYLAVQVDTENGFIRAWGYTSHRWLKAHATYDGTDRAYCLSSELLLEDLDMLSVERESCPEVQTRGVVPALQILEPVQAQNLIERLGNPVVVFPRLAVPFELWGALLAHGGWRRRLYERRQGFAEQWSVLDWLRVGISPFAQTSGWGSLELQAGFLGRKGFNETVSQVVLSRQMTIAGQRYDLRVVPQGNPEERTWRFELWNASPGDRIPGGFKLRLLSEDLQSFDNNEDTAAVAVDRLYVDVIVGPEDGVVWEIEPIPDDYDREILRF